MLIITNYMEMISTLEMSYDRKINISLAEIRILVKFLYFNDFTIIDVRKLRGWI